MSFLSRKGKTFRERLDAESQLQSQSQSESQQSEENSQSQDDKKVHLIPDADDEEDDWQAFNNPRSKTLNSQGNKNKTIDLSSSSDSDSEKSSSNQPIGSYN